MLLLLVGSSITAQVLALSLLWILINYPVGYAHRKNTWITNIATKCRGKSSQVAELKSFAPLFPWPLLKSKEMAKESSDWNVLHLWRSREKLSCFYAEKYVATVFIKRLLQLCVTISKFALDFKLLENLSKSCLLSCVNKRLIKLK